MLSVIPRSLPEVRMRHLEQEKHRNDLAYEEIELRSNDKFRDSVIPRSHPGVGHSKWTT